VPAKVSPPGKAGRLFAALKANVVIDSRRFRSCRPADECCAATEIAGTTSQASLDALLRAAYAAGRKGTRSDIALNSP
jgi:hypothetical protein